MKTVSYLDPAKAEMIEAARYYEEEAHGLGHDFLDEIEHTVSMLQKYPRSGRLVRNGIRRRLVRRFPFGILFGEESDEIVIVAVMHLKRRPDYWLNRI